MIDPDDGLHDGEIKFVLTGERLNGKFRLVLLKPRPNQRSPQDNRLLIKGHGSELREGANAEALEAAVNYPGTKPSDTKRADNPSPAPPVVIPGHDPGIATHADPRRAPANDTVKTSHHGSPATTAETTPPN